MGLFNSGSVFCGNAWGADTVNKSMGKDVIWSGHFSRFTYVRTPYMVKKKKAMHLERKRGGGRILHWIIDVIRPYE